MADPKTNIAASVRDRLKNESRKQGTTLNALLIRYGLERFLYRLGQSPHRDRYLLKGAMLFVSWADMPFRQTQDLDLSAPAPFDPDRVEARIYEPLRRQSCEFISLDLFREGVTVDQLLTFGDPRYVGISENGQPIRRQLEHFCNRVVQPG